MHVLFVTPYGFNDRYRYFTEFVIARVLAHRGWSISACVRHAGEKSAVEQSEGMEICRVRGKRRTLRSLSRMVSRAEVVHIFHLRNSLAVPALMLSRIYRKAVIFSEYGLLHDPFLVRDRDDPLASPLCFRQTLWSRLYRLPMTAADRVLFLSRHNLEFSEKLGISNDRVGWLPAVVDGRRFEEKETARLSGKAQAPPEPFALFVGQLKLRKGWDILLRSVPDIPAAVLPKVVVVSSTHDSPPPHFVGLVQSLGIEDRITYFPGVRNADLEQLYRRCSLLCVPSRYEGFGLPVLEAFEFEKPVVAADVPALNEIIQHGVNGYLVPPKEPAALARAITEILSNQNLASSLAEGGRETLTDYRAEVWIDCWIDLYKKTRRGRATSSSVHFR